MLNPLPPQPSPKVASTLHPQRSHLSYDDAGNPVRTSALGVLMHPPERDYDFEERAAIARSEDSLVVLRQRAFKLILWVGFIWGFVGYVSLVLIVTALEQSQAALLAGLPFLFVTVALVIIFIYPRRMPAQAIAERVGAGLCGRCARRLSGSSNNPGLIECRACGLLWNAERVSPKSSDALADRRTRVGCACFAKDARGVVAPLAAAFAGAWPGGAASPGSTPPEARAQWARMLALQRTAWRILALCVVVGVGVLIMAAAHSIHLAIVLAALVLGALATLVTVELIMVTNPRRPSAWLRRGVHATTSHWLSEWRCPCCDGELEKLGRWHLWGVASVLCDRCRCVWQLHDLGKVTLRTINRCAGCDYDISGLAAVKDEAARCPECGMVLLGAVILRCRACQVPLRFAPSSHAHALACSACGQMNDVRWSIPGSIRPQIVYGDKPGPRVDALAGSSTP